MSSPSSANSATDPSPAAPGLPAVEIEERVRYSETDGMGVAHHRNYFVWFELGRTEFCRRQGLTYREIEELGYFLVVAEAACHYKKPLRYDDRIVVRTVLREARARKFVFSYEVRRADDGQLAATGESVHVVVDRNARVTALPKAVLDRLTAP